MRANAGEEPNVLCRGRTDACSWGRRQHGHLQLHQRLDHQSIALSAIRPVDGVRDTRQEKWVDRRTRHFPCELRRFSEAEHFVRAKCSLDRRESQSNWRWKSRVSWQKSTPMTYQTREGHQFVVAVGAGEKATLVAFKLEAPRN
jgi:hypothetical protein